MERLKAAGLLLHTRLLCTFTFQYGEIKRSEGRGRTRGNKTFTFQYGEIKSCNPSPTRIGDTNLHSSMERLKAAGLLLHTRLLCTFTFQYGEIKRFGARRRYRLIDLFTFQYGEIKRLPIDVVQRWIYEFTFQYGEIKSVDLKDSVYTQLLIYIPVWRD